MTYSYLTHLECSRCGKTYDADSVQGTCTCASPLLAQYDLVQASKNLTRTELSARPANLWRYHELLPVRLPDSVVSLGERITPLVGLPRLGVKYGIPGLVMKDEGLLPTGTFKARGAAVGISRAKELGVAKVAMPTNGNAGAAWAAYAARGGLGAYIVMPIGAPLIARAECTVTGAELHLVDGLIGDAAKVVARAVASQGYVDVSTLREPYRLEGKKTMGLELFEQLNWEGPDVVLYPTGGGVGLIGIFKALEECEALGWIRGRRPRLVAVQASGCAPIVRAWNEGSDTTEEWPDPVTIAFGINVAKPLGDFLILKALHETNGCAVAVDDPDLLAAQQDLGRTEGFFVCPEGAACLAAAKQLRDQDWIRASDTVVVLNTGSGLKYPNAVSVRPDSAGYVD